jgi:hypothetical protein
MESNIDKKVSFNMKPDIKYFNENDSNTNYSDTNYSKYTNNDKYLNYPLKSLLKKEQREKSRTLFNNSLKQGEIEMSGQEEQMNKKILRYIKKNKTKIIYYVLTGIINTLILSYLFNEKILKKKVKYIKIFITVILSIIISKFLINKFIFN